MVFVSKAFGVSFGVEADGVDEREAEEQLTHGVVDVEHELQDEI